MTALQARRLNWDFDGDVPFLWLPGNPPFSAMMNAISVIAVAFEPYIVTAVREAMGTITDPGDREEAEAFLRQEAQHTRAHREHVNALVRRYPGLRATVSEAMAMYDRLREEEPLAFHLAYVADLEATFTPTFKLWLDHEEALFRPGDGRVASVLLWHFVEEVEHRSSALIIYGAVVQDPWYRVRALPHVRRHVMSVLEVITAGFNEHVPFEERQFDARNFLPRHRFRQQVMSLVTLGRRPAPPPVVGKLPRARVMACTWGLLKSQMPGHDPARQPLPAFAGEWMRRYESGADVTRYYTAAARPS
jgi:predicted metal-dependent hydrolase